jgi:hypothetical protein
MERRRTAAISSTDRCRREVKQRQIQETAEKCGGGDGSIFSQKDHLLPCDGLRGYNNIDSRVLCFSNAYLDGLTSKLAPRGEGVRPRPLRHSMMCKAVLWADNPLGVRNRRPPMPARRSS